MYLVNSGRKDGYINLLIILSWVIINLVHFNTKNKGHFKRKRGQKDVFIKSSTWIGSYWDTVAFLLWYENHGLVD